MKSLVLVGRGPWGQNYIKTLNDFAVKLTVVGKNGWKDAIDTNPDGVIVCTPPQSHVEIASYALEKNIPTMIEKPLSLSLEEAKILEKYSASILVNHVHLFSSNYQYIKEYVSPSNIEYIISEGLGNSLPRDYSELWDYGPHDLSMILDLAQTMPVHVECFKHIDRQFIIQLTFDTFKSCSVVGYHKEPDKRRWLLTNDGRQPLVYDRYNSVNDFFYKSDLPLTNALKVFIDSIDGKGDYRLGLNLSLKILKILEECDKALTANSLTF